MRRLHDAIVIEVIIEITIPKVPVNQAAQVVFWNTQLFGQFANGKGAITIAMLLFDLSPEGFHPTAFRH